MNYSSTQRRSQAIAQLKRTIASADTAGQAYSKIQSALSALWAAEAHSRSEQESEILAAEIERYQALVDEMYETSVQASNDLAEWEQGL